MTYPTDIPGFQAALVALVTPPAEAADAVFAAQGAVSPVLQCVQVLAALSPHVESLNLEAAQLLASAAHLILVGGWHGRGAEALAARDAALDRIAELSA
jgi:hypothetical protein